MPPSQPFWEEILLSAIGPLITVVFGGVVVGSVVALLQRRRDERQSFRELTVEMFHVAYGFYTPVEEATRRRRYHQPELPTELLDAKYQEFAVAGRSIEARLRVAGSNHKTIEARWLWHCILDLLTVLFFHYQHSRQRLDDLILGQQGEHDRTRRQGEDELAEKRARKRSLTKRLARPHEQRVLEAVTGRFLAPARLPDPDYVKDQFADAMDKLIMLRQRNARRRWHLLKESEQGNLKTNQIQAKS